MKVRQHLTIALIAFLAAGCSIVRQPSFPSQGPFQGPSQGEELVRVAAGLIGTPYRFGGDDPRGFDCSGLVFYSFDRLGIEVPRTAEDQRRAARKIDPDSLSIGDLVFFRGSARRVDHVGIYAGEGRFIHAPSSGHVVSYSYLDDPYYREHFVSAGRLR